MFPESRVESFRMKLRVAYRHLMKGLELNRALVDNYIYTEGRCLWVWSFFDMNSPDQFSRLLILLNSYTQQVIARSDGPALLEMSEQDREALKNFMWSLADVLDDANMMVDDAARGSLGF